MKKKNTYLILLILVFMTAVSFARIVGNDFINFDDIAYITANHPIQSGINCNSIQWAMTTTYFSYWHPLTWLSHMLDWSLFGNNASGHHLVNLILHIGAVIFLFLFLNKTTGDVWPSAFAAAFFAMHPLRVESVAWASERKDVLSMFFGMGCLYAYAFYAERPQLSRYLLCFTLFLLALMSKPIMVTIPFILILLDYWPLGRWSKALNGAKFNATRIMIAEKIPFILIAVVVCFLTFWAQNRDDQIASMDQLPLFDRMGNALIAYTLYLEKTFWPNSLAIFYPYNSFLPLGKLFISGIIITIITCFVFYHRRKLPFLFVGWLIYLGTLVPVIGFVQSGGQSVADRYTYLPSIGLVIMLTWGMLSLMKTGENRQTILSSVAIVIILFMAFLTWKQCGYWKNSIEIFSHALSVTQNNYLAHNSRGIAYGEAGEFQKAIDDFTEAVSFKPDYFKAYNNRGFTYAKLGQYQDAVHNYNEAIRLKPDYAIAYNNRSFVFLNQGNIVEGCNDAKKACLLGICSTLEETKRQGHCHE